MPDDALELFYKGLEPLTKMRTVAPEIRAGLSLLLEEGDSVLGYRNAWIRRQVVPVLRARRLTMGDKPDFVQALQILQSMFGSDVRRNLEVSLFQEAVKEREKQWVQKKSTPSSDSAKPGA